MFRKCFCIWIFSVWMFCWIYKLVLIQQCTQPIEMKLHNSNRLNIFNRKYEMFMALANAIKKTIFRIFYDEVAFGIFFVARKCWYIKNWIWWFKQHTQEDIALEIFATHLKSIVLVECELLEIAKKNKEKVYEKRTFTA